MNLWEWRGGLRALVVGCACLILLIMDTRGHTRRLAGNFIVPAGWVMKPDFRTGAFWGTLLGMGLITEAPFIVFHLGLIAAVIHPAWGVPILSGVVFALGRVVAALLPPVRMAIMDSLESEGRVIPVANLLSHLTVIAVLGLSVLALFSARVR